MENVKDAEQKYFKKIFTSGFLRLLIMQKSCLQGLDTINWPEKTKLMQRNWIGKSIGAEVDFKCDELR